MNKPRAVVATSAVFLSAALVASYFQLQEPTIKATDVLTWDCESAEYKPESITLTCADGGELIRSITWTTWTSKSASGTGIYSINLCNPSCAEGQRLEEPVEVVLSDAEQVSKKIAYKTLIFTTLSGQNLPQENTKEGRWELGKQK
jgi:hypothetical protein